VSARLLNIHTQKQTSAQNLFFAYGSNMNPTLIRKRCSYPVRIGTACLPDYQIGFYGYSEEWDGALETAVEAKGKRLWGVLYALNDLDWERLDLWQDARFDGAGMYFHYPVEVCDLQGMRYEARLYKKDVLYEPRHPSNSYMEYILRGAQENQLPPAYIESLKAIKTTPARYAVPVRVGVNPGDFAGVNCTTCSSAV
jgi:hypothetical protein